MFLRKFGPVFAPEGTETAVISEEAPIVPEEEKVVTATQETADPPVLEKSTTKETTKELPWYGELDDEDLKKAATKFASPADVLRYAAEARRRESLIRVPGKDATEEDWAKYHKAVGVPESPDKYELPKLENETEAQKASREGWAKVFHENKLSQAQVAGILDAFGVEQLQEMEDTKAADQEHFKQQQTSLKKEWGGEYDRNLLLAERALQELTNRAGVPLAELRSLETKAGRFLLDDARFAKMMAIVGREMAEGTFPGAITTDERQSIESQIAERRKQSSAAADRGDSKEANRLYQETLALQSKLTGGQPIVGVQGRAA